MTRALFTSAATAAALAVAACGPALAQLTNRDGTVALDVPYVSTPQPVVERMLEMAEIEDGDFLIDLGSGDGRIPVTAAREYGIQAMGVDIDPERIREANENAQRNRVTDLVEFHEQDLFETSLAEADVLAMYLLSSVNLDLRPRILEEMRPGARVVSHAFNMGDWEPDEQDTVGYSRIYKWIVPADVAGDWRIEGAEGLDGPVTVSFEQRFQKIDGQAEVNGSTVPVQEASLSGADIRFVIDTGNGESRAFVGRVDGNTIVPGDDADWTAVRQ